MATMSLLETALANFEQAVVMLKDEVDPEILERLHEPKERIELTLCPRFDDGKRRVFRAFVVRHSDALGPSKGGIRMTPTVTIDDITGLAMDMTWKCALIGVPFGGGKSGIVADAETIIAINKETMIRRFARAAIRHIGPQVYVPAPDMGTNESDMGHLKDTICYSVGMATTQGCYVTGKPLILGGIPGRREATGRGVVMCTVEALKSLGIEVQGTTAIVQGYGNVGSVAAKALDELGAKIIGVEDIHGAIYNAKGIDLDALNKHVAKTGTVKGFDGTNAIDSAKLLEMPCDVLIPAAAANQITAENAPRISAKVIAEGANAPTTPEADKILAQRDILIIPDILCNAGGVFVSYLEFTQETQQEQMTEEQVQTRLRMRMTEKYHQVAKLANERNLHMREAAMYLAIRTVCQAITARGRTP